LWTLVEVIGMAQGNGVRKPGRGVFLLGAVFLSSRLLLLPFPQPTSDVSIYAQYAHECATAAWEGVPFYELHSRGIDARAEKARGAGRLVGSLEEYKNVEYPPLALLFMQFPRLWLDSSPEDEELPPTFAGQYLTVFRAGMAVVDVALFAVLIVLARRWYAGESQGQRVQRLALYVFATLLLWHLLYDRLDLVLALLIVLALGLLASRFHYLWSFAVLAVAVNFKVAPMVLAPIWVLGSMTSGEILSLARPRGFLVPASRSCFLVVLVIGCFLPFYLTAGKPALGFLTYHQARGLEIGSVYSSLPLTSGLLGDSIAVEYSYGSINVRSALAAALVRLAPWFTAGSLLVATVLVLVHCRRLAGANAADSAVELRLAQLHPQIFAAYALLFLMVFILTNKVFSPQYLLWLAPLLALAPFEGGSRRRLFGGFLLVCLLSTLLVPFLFLVDLYDPASETVPLAFKEPTPRICAFLIGRNLLFTALTLGVSFSLHRYGRRPASGPVTAAAGPSGGGSMSAGGYGSPPR
jgi:hypothetical protein